MGLFTNLFRIPTNDRYNEVYADYVGAPTRKGVPLHVKPVAHLAKSPRHETRKRKRNSLVKIFSEC